MEGNAKCFFSELPYSASPIFAHTNPLRRFDPDNFVVISVTKATDRRDMQRLLKLTGRQSQKKELARQSPASGAAMNDRRQAAVAIVGGATATNKAGSFRV